MMRECERVTSTFVYSPYAHAFPVLKIYRFFDQQVVVAIKSFVHFKMTYEHPDRFLFR